MTKIYDIVLLIIWLASLVLYVTLAIMLSNVWFYLPAFVALIFIFAMIHTLADPLIEGE